MNELYDLITWDKLKKINSSKVINSMYIWIFIVPIILKIFEKINERIYNFNIFGENIPLHLDLPFSLTIFYFSAIFFALGNIIIKLRCPLIIIENNSFSDYENSGKDFLQLKDYSYDINFNWDKYIKGIYNEIDKKVLKEYKQDSMGGLVSHSKEDKEKEEVTNFFRDDMDINDFKKSFWKFYTEAKIIRKNYRLVTGIFYMLGFGLMSIILGQNFYFVIKSLF